LARRGKWSKKIGDMMVDISPNIDTKRPYDGIIRSLRVNGDE